MNERSFIVKSFTKSLNFPDVLRKSSRSKALSEHPFCVALAPALVRVVAASEQREPNPKQVAAAYLTISSPILLQQRDARQPA